MSQPRSSDVSLSKLEREKGAITCRIPQRLPTPGRFQKRTPSIRPRPNPELQKAKFDTNVKQPRYTVKSVKNIISRHRVDEFRPKSGNRGKLEMTSGTTAQTVTRLTRPTEREKLLPAPKRQSIIPKRVVNTNMNQAVLHKSLPARPVITVPISQKQLVKSIHTTKNMSYLPDQETIKKHEELELKEGNKSDGGSREFIEGESVRSDKVMKLRHNWQEKMVQFETMKNELSAQQHKIIELYSVIKNTHQKLQDMGHNVHIPSSEDLQIMNVAKLSPDQLLQLCGSPNHSDGKQTDQLIQGTFSIDLQKLYDMPSNLVAACEQALIKRNEVIEWFESLKSVEKGISVSKLTTKLNEFHAENNMLHLSLEVVKKEFYKELNDTVEILRKGVSEVINLQLRNEDLTFQLAELNTRHMDMKKQMQNAEHIRPQTYRHKAEELERELKEEKCKKTILKDRLTRTEGQLKMSTDQVASLEAALETARAQTWSLERTVQQLRNQNQKLQAEFDKELTKLTDSIRENTAHLEEIAIAREKLQKEKEDLENRLNELSQNYTESILQIKLENDKHFAKVIETEKQITAEIEAKQQLTAKVESLCAQLLESELQSKDFLCEKEKLTSQNKVLQSKLEQGERDLKMADTEVNDYRSRLLEQGEAIKEIEREFRKTIDINSDLQQKLKDKDDYINELKKRQSVLEQQLTDSELKMDSYQEQLSMLKDHINELQQEFGELQNVNDLNETLTQQKSKLLEVIKQNSELSDALQKKTFELEKNMNHIAEQEHILEHRDKLIKMLSEKEEEHLNIIKLLRNNLEIRAHADAGLNQQLADKNTEVESLVTNLETRKLQITQLEKIILTLEEQTRKAYIQRNKDQEKIACLENKIMELESQLQVHDVKASVDNLDNLMKILEEELGAPTGPNLITREQYLQKNYYNDASKQDKEYHEKTTSKKPKLGNEAMSTKIVMRSNNKKNYYTSGKNCTNENLARKKGITNIESKKCKTAPELDCSNISILGDPQSITERLQNFADGENCYKENYLLTRQYTLLNQLRDQKKCKMYKLAGHKL